MWAPRGSRSAGGSVPAKTFFDVVPAPVLGAHASPGNEAAEGARDGPPRACEGVAPPGGGDGGAGGGPEHGSRGPSPERRPHGKVLENQYFEISFNNRKTEYYQ